MMSLHHKFGRAFLVLVAAVALPVFAANGGAKAELESLSTQAALEKERLVTANMNLSRQEANAFWPIYDAYQADLYKINVRLVNLINEYALAYNKGAILDDTAKKLLDESIAIEMDEARLKQAYAPRLMEVLSSAKAARYLQIENKIRANVRYEITGHIPLAR